MDAKMLIHPGEILKEEFLVPYGLSANRLALAIGVPPNRITAIINGDARDHRRDCDAVGPCLQHYARVLGEPTGAV